jgi:hypothetical protein
MGFTSLESLPEYIREKQPRTIALLGAHLKIAKCLRRGSNAPMATCISFGLFSGVAT